MPNNQIKVFNLVKRMRYKYREQNKDQSQIDKIMWWSIPVVYPNWDREALEIDHQQLLRHQKKKRVNAMLREMWTEQDNLAFVTLTFSDDVLKTTTEQTRHRYAAKWLGEQCRDYVANIDHGAKTGREHYHAVVAFNNLLPTQEWLYGYSSIKPINKGVDNAKSKMSAYIVKLQNHAGKIGTGRLFRKRGMKTVDNLPF